MLTSVSDPIKFFETWLQEAEKREINNYNAMTLATVSKDGQPSSRVVLLKDIWQDKFVFYTNLESRKGEELGQCPKAALSFYWKSLDRQVRIEGSVEQVPDEMADAYFGTRPRLSRLGAWASDQSRPLGSLEILQNRLETLEKKYPDDQIPRPPHWSGFAVAAQRIEFWDQGQYRLHERILYTKEGNRWVSTRLYP